MKTPNPWVDDVAAVLDLSPNQPLPNRRLALKTALGVGYVAASGPLMAQTAVKTTSDGLITGEVTIRVGGTQVPAYRAAPRGTTQLPTILVVSEIFGVHEYIADVCRRWAHAGFLAIAPEMFVRQGDPTELGEVAKINSEIIAKVPDAQCMADLDAWADWAVANGGAPGRLGISGFCWGGRITWLYATHAPKLKAAVAWYGRLEGPTTPLQPQHPLARVEQLKAPVLGLYGAADAGIPNESWQRMQQALREWGEKGNAAARQSEFVVYPDTPHAFHADYRPTYREGPARDGWNRAVAWMKRFV